MKFHEIVETTQLHFLISQLFFDQSTPISSRFEDIEWKFQMQWKSKSYVFPGLGKFPRKSMKIGGKGNVWRKFVGELYNTSTLISSAFLEKNYYFRTKKILGRSVQEWPRYEEMKLAVGSENRKFPTFFTLKKAIFWFPPNLILITTETGV